MHGRSVLSYRKFSRHLTTAIVKLVDLVLYYNCSILIIFDFDYRLQQGADDRCTTSVPVSPSSYVFDRT